MLTLAGITFTFLSQDLKHCLQRFASLGKGLRDTVGQRINIRTMWAKDEHASQIEESEAVAGLQVVAFAETLG